MKSIVVALVMLAALVGSRPTLAGPAPVPTSYIFAGMADGHIYRSADGGVTWRKADAGAAQPFSAIQNLAMTPNGRKIYALLSSGAVWVSTDNGSTWAKAGGVGANALMLAVGSPDGSTLYAISNDDSFHKSTDGGKTWNTSDLAGGPVRIAVSPRRPDTILVGTDGFGLLISTDAGKHWTLVKGGPTTEEVWGLAFDIRRPQLAYAATDGGLYTSANGGMSWHKAPLPFEGSSAVAVDPSGQAGVLAANFGRAAIARSRDGRSWRRTSVPSGKGGVTAIAFDPAHPTRVVAGLDTSGILISVDSGDSWRKAPNPGGDGSFVFSLAATPTS